MGQLYWLISMPSLPQVVKFSGWGRWPFRPWFSMACTGVNLANLAISHIHVVLHADEAPLVLVLPVLVAGPDLLKVGHNVVSAEEELT